MNLSIVIATLNEQNSLPLLLADLCKQKHIEIQIIIADGGSKDDSKARVDAMQDEHITQIKWLTCPAGRAHQFNYGARYANNELILFLHADTRIDDTELLSKAVTFFSTQSNSSKQHAIAGHFGLRFMRDQANFKKAYYFYESKTHLNRMDCINGDQGLLITREFYYRLGGFDESLPYLEDARLAKRIFERGRWVTLPGVVNTSARRFETEGLIQRQILNSFICNFMHLEVDYFFTAAVDAYRAQDKTKALNLRPFLVLAHRQILRDGMKYAFKRWYGTGKYIAANAWQLAFALDCRKNQKQGYESGKGPMPICHFYDRYLARIINSFLGNSITAVLTVVWFYALFLRYRKSS